MTHDDRLSQLEAELDRAKKAEQKPTKRPSQAGYAFRVGTELVSGVAVGFALGYGIDAWFDTRPWGTALGALFGFAAGMRLMIETSKRAGHELEETEQEQEE